MAFDTVQSARSRLKKIPVPRADVVQEQGGRCYNIGQLGEKLSILKITRAETHKHMSPSIKGS